MLISYAQTETGRRKSVEKTRRYQLSEKGQKTKEAANKRYYNNHKEKWLTPEMLQRAKSCTEARTLMRKIKRSHLCVECGTNSVKLDVHHINEDWTNNDPSNLEYRCKKCHNRIHGKIPQIVSIEDNRRKTPWTEEEILMHLKQAKSELKDTPFTQTTYNKIAKGRPTSKTILKIRSWKDWMELLT